MGQGATYAQNNMQEFIQKLYSAETYEELGDVFKEMGNTRNKDPQIGVPAYFICVSLINNYSNPYVTSYTGTSTGTRLTEEDFNVKKDLFSRLDLSQKREYLIGLYKAGVQAFVPADNAPVRMAMGNYLNDNPPAKKVARGSAKGEIKTAEVEGVVDESIIDEPVVEPNISQKVKVEFELWVKDLYSDFGLTETDMSFECFKEGMTAFLNGFYNGDLKRTDVFTIVDYSVPSTQKRMFVFDIRNKRVLYQLYAAHGAKPTNRTLMAGFSNVVDTNLSSIGFAVTGGTDMGGKVGHHLVLYGRDHGENISFNGNIFDREIIMHGREYAREPALRNGVYRLGCSNGCITIDDRISRKVMDLLAGGSGIFIYGADEAYTKNSGYQDGAKAASALYNFLGKQKLVMRE